MVGARRVVPRVAVLPLLPVLPLFAYCTIQKVFTGNRGKVGVTRVTGNKLAPPWTMRRRDRAKGGLVAPRDEGAGKNSRGYRGEEHGYTMAACTEIARSVYRSRVK